MPTLISSIPCLTSDDIPLIFTVDAVIFVILSFTSTDDSLTFSVMLQVVLMFLLQPYNLQQSVHIVFISFILRASSLISLTMFAKSIPYVYVSLPSGCN